MMQLTAFGWGTAAGDDLFEATFVQEGNMLTDDGGNIGMILFSAGAGAPWDFTQDFNEGWSGFSKTFYMPEPSTMVVMSIAGIGLLRKRRR